MALVEHRTLVANTVTTVTFGIEEPRGNLLSFESTPTTRIEVMSVDGAAKVYFTTDGTTPTVGGSGCHVLAAAISSIEVADETPGPTSVVKLISAGAPQISVRAV